MKFFNAVLIKLLFVVGLSSGLFGNVGNFSIEEIYFKNDLAIGRDAEPTFKTSTITTDEDLKFVISVFNTDTNEKVYSKEYIHTSETLNDKFLQLSSTWIPKTTGNFNCTIDIFNENGTLINTESSVSDTLNSSTFISRFIDAFLLTNLQLSGYSIDSLEDAYTLVKDNYNNNKKLLFYYKMDYTKNVSTLVGIGGGVKIIVDLSDYFGISEEGKAGWITTWFDPYYITDISLPASLEAGIIEFQYTQTQEDFRRDFVPVNFGGSLKAGNIGTEISTYDLINDFNVNTEDSGSVNIGIGFNASLTFARELNTIAFNNIWNSILKDKNIFNMDYLNYLVPMTPLSYYSMVLEIQDLYQVIKEEKDNNNIRDFTISDINNNNNFISEEYPQKLNLISASTSIKANEELSVTISEEFSNSSVDITNVVEFSSYPIDALTYTNGIIKWNNASYDEAQANFMYDGRFDSYTITKEKSNLSSSFTLSKSSANINDTVTASYNGTNTDIAQYIWKLYRADGTSTTLANSNNVSFTASSVGGYTLKLKVIDNFGQESEFFEKSIKVNKVYVQSELEIYKEGYAELSIGSLGTCDFKNVKYITVPNGETWNYLKVGGSKQDVILILNKGSSYPSLDNKFASGSQNDCDLGYSQRFDDDDAVYDYGGGTRIDKFGGPFPSGTKIYFSLFSYDGENNADSININISVKKDKDGDSVPDDKDDFPNDPSKQYDSDHDGIDNSIDKFDNDPAASIDSDDDGYPDEWHDGHNETTSSTGLKLDRFKNDSAAAIDSDNDGYPNSWNSGKSQTDSTSNPKLELDLFPEDITEWADSDGDNVGDNSDLFDDDPTEWADSDGDNVGDNVDVAPNDPLRTTNIAPEFQNVESIIKVDIGTTKTITINAIDNEGDNLTFEIVSTEDNISSFVTLDGNQLTVNGIDKTEQELLFFINVKDQFNGNATKIMKVQFIDNSGENVSRNGNNAVVYIANIQACQLIQKGFLEIPQNEKWTNIKLGGSGQDVIVLMSKNSEPEKDSPNETLTCENGYAQAFDSDFKVDYNGGTSIDDWNADFITGDKVYFAVFSYGGITNGEDITVNLEIEDYRDTDNDGEPNSTDSDDDGDGISDEFENNYDFLDPLDGSDANLDPDEDGKTNLEEYQDGTNPQEKTSKMFTLNLKQGWNLVSLELNSTIDLNTIDNTNIEVVRSLKNDQWSTWTKENLNNPDQYFNILEDGYGYWIKATQDTPLEIKGNGEANTVTITPNQWNMIGSIKYEDINQFFIDNPNVKMIWKYKGGQYHVISNDINIDSDLTSLESNGDVIELQSIENNEGIFVK